MAHIQDRWWTDGKKDPETGKTKKVKTTSFGKGLRWKVRYIDPETGKERSKSFPNNQKNKATDFKVEMEADIREGRFVDPDAGKMTLRAYSQNWLKGQAADPVSRQTLERKLGGRILPFLGDKALHVAEKPGTIRDWLDWLRSEGVSENYAANLFDLLSSVLSGAVEDKKIHTNPCRLSSVKRPKTTPSPAVAWERTRVSAIRLAMPARYQIAVTLGVGLGLRHGEIFGLSSDDIDHEASVIHVRRQVRYIDGECVFSLPKRNKTRTVPASPALLAEITAHLDNHPAQNVTLPWGKPGGKRVTVPLLLPAPGGSAWKRHDWSNRVWYPAFEQAGITRRSRIDGMHALRHTYASAMLSGGVNIRDLAEYLGHSDPGMTLRIYTHMVPSSHQRARNAADHFLAGQNAAPSAA